jgi:uncharacterized protein (DUF2235 family)
MSKNIVLLSDGTGNSAKAVFKTNVWRLFQLLDLRDPDSQIAFYDDGVGTSSFKLFAALGGIFGFGLKRNVIDIYSFCCRNYGAGDRIYGFGFSRGAFTIRVVAGFIARIGLVRYDGNDARLARDAEIAYREYRKVRDYKSGANILIKPLRGLRDWVSQSVFRKLSYQELRTAGGFVDIEKFDFLGVWDTVDAYGGPIEEITRAIDYWYWPLSMPDQFMNHKIGRACHALALEEERDAFRPVLWDDRYVRGSDGLLPVRHDWAPPAPCVAPIDEERISQVWFVGVHSDIGGGYPRDGLSYWTLEWMVERATVYGLRTVSSEQDALNLRADPYDKLNDSRHGFGGYYRYRPRKFRDLYEQPPYKLSFVADFLHIVDLWRGRPDPDRELRGDLAKGVSYERRRPLPKVHASVLDRVDFGIDKYAPIVLPDRYQIVGRDGSLTDSESIEPGSARATRQEAVWDWVWGRRVTYFATVFVSLLLASLPLINKKWPGPGPSSPAEIVVPLIDLAGAFLPSFARPWLDAFRQTPGRFLVGVVLIVILLYASGWMQGHIRDLMRSIWHSPDAPARAPGGAIYALRSSGPYQAFFYVLKHWLLPSLFAIVIFILLASVVVAAVNRTAFTMFDAIGKVCVPSSEQGGVTGRSHATFDTGQLCAATGLAVERHRSYRVTLVVTDPWEDGHRFEETDPAKAKGIETGPEGFGYEKMRPLMWLGIPIRRLIASNWFTPVLRIGNRGFGELVLHYERKDAPPCQCPSVTTYSATFRAKKSGELFAYVNDSVVGLPGYFDTFYKNNKGKAEVTIELLPEE